MDDDLKNMLAAYERSPAIYRPSKFWDEMNRKNIEQLQKEGFDEFKQTLNRNYFQFSIHLRNPQLWHLVLTTNPLSYIPILFKLRFDEPPKKYFLRPRNVRIYTWFMAMLIAKVRARDTLRLLDSLEEPIVGDPFRVSFKGKLVSQDLCNSILEFYSVHEGVRFPQQGIRIAELGGGYGRTAFVFLALKPAKYSMFDIPPALYVAQRYLSAVCPDARIFRFREFTDFEAIRAEYEASDIAFFLPHQLALFPKESFDLFMNISSFGEMRKEQIHNYFTLIEKVCTGFFYNKQWRLSVNAPDNITVAAADYPVNPAWKKIFFRTTAVQNRFFEALYRLR